MTPGREAIMYSIPLFLLSKPNVEIIGTWGRKG